MALNLQIRHKQQQEMITALETDTAIAFYLGRTHTIFFRLGSMLVHASRLPYLFL